MSHPGENTMISCGLSPRVRAIRRASWWLKGMGLTQIKKSLAKDSIIALSYGTASQAQMPGQDF